SLMRTSVVILILLSPTASIIFPFLFFFNLMAPTETYTLSLHDALPIFEHPELIAWRIKNFASAVGKENLIVGSDCGFSQYWEKRSEEHTSELQSRFDLVCRLLLEKKKNVNLHFHAVQFMLTLPTSSVDH